MNKIVFLMVTLLMISCKNDDDNRDQNPFLPPSAIGSYQINLNLPQFNPLKFPSGFVEDTSDNGSIRGIGIFNANDTQYIAFELSDPNLTPSACSRLSVEGFIASCNCDGCDNEYDILTGQPTKGGGQYGLRFYNIRREGNVLIITD
ncbi:hypothetical protein ABW636_20630 [Aquimarina sp. 2201CG1-2-11]|uniref:hypothetical protein n=1 Tax=Aquimarina discodermiae TaxID=3231043 RepID=UPI003461E7F0